MELGASRSPERSRLGPRLSDAVRIGVAGFVDEIVTFLVANVAWAILAGALVYVVGSVPVALVVAPLTIPLTCGLARVATEVARERVVSARSFVAGVRDRFWTKLGLGAVQVLVLVVAIADLLLAPTIGGLPAVVSAILAVYVAISSVAYGLVFWTLIVDPEHAALSVRQLARLALAVVLRHPGPVAFLLAYGILAAGVMAALIVPILFLPSIVLLTVAAYVVPAADAVRGRGPSQPEGRG